MASYPTELKFLLSKNVENEPKITHWKTHQHTAALLANLAAMCCGIAMAWTSPALPLIQRETNVTLPLYATEEQASWISSLLPIGALTGALPAGYMANIFGRRKVLLVTAVVYLIGWVVIVSADVFDLRRAAPPARNHGLSTSRWYGNASNHRGAHGPGVSPGWTS
ncbi:facilitated trehalose transporter Tret1 isoform X2 [Anabrus simplex]|uniref:facilitated trehalose transporter Tret1 isoform X2 n=1 Tax=Anabrus simplex TaxID=316456 RepID=UPI0035A36772